MLWFAWKFVPLWYQQQPLSLSSEISQVVICLKIRTFVVSATTLSSKTLPWLRLWFAWKFVPLWYQQQHCSARSAIRARCDLLENSYLCGISNNITLFILRIRTVVICLKIRTFVVSATTHSTRFMIRLSCDLLENSYLCGISNNHYDGVTPPPEVVICLKIRTFVVSATTNLCILFRDIQLWFAWKFVPLWYQQQLLFGDI